MMPIPSVQKTDSSIQASPSANQSMLKSCSRVILQIALAALSLLVGSLAAAAGLIPAVFTVTGVYGVIAFGVMAATLTSIITNHLFIKSSIPASATKSSEVTKEEKKPEATQEVSLEQFYKTLREKCRKDLIHATQLIENVFAKSEKKQHSEKLADEDRATHKSAAWMLTIIKPETSQKKELSRASWEAIYNHYDSIVVRSTKINEALKKRFSDSKKSTLHDKSSGIEAHRVAWMRAVQNVEKCEISLERIRTSKKPDLQRLEEYTKKLAVEQQDLGKREAIMDKWDKRLVKGDKEYRKTLQSFVSSSEVRESVGA